MNADFVSRLRCIPGCAGGRGTFKCYAHVPCRDASKVYICVSGLCALVCEQMRAMSTASELFVASTVGCT